MNGRGYKLIVFCAFLGLSPRPHLQSRNASDTIQMVFIGLGWGAGSETPMGVEGGHIQFRRATPIEGGGFLVDHKKFYPDQKVVESRYREHQIVDRLLIKEGALYLEGRPVRLPPDVKIRTIYQAILWRGWVICLCRTSLSDSLLSLRPPFVATELITFSTSDMAAKVKWLSSFAPVGTRLYILDGTS